MKVWNLETGKVDILLEDPEKRYVRALAVLPDGRVVSAHDDTIKVWNLETGKMDILLKNSENRSTDALAVLADGRVVSTHGHTIKVWNVEAGKADILLKDPEKLDVNALAVMRDGGLVGGVHRTVRMWIEESSVWTQRAAFVADADIFSLAFSESLHTVIAGDGAGGVHFLKAERPDVGLSE